MLFDRDTEVCFFCGIPTLVDHGYYDSYNDFMCEFCNGDKGEDDDENLC